MYLDSGGHRRDFQDAGDLGVEQFVSDAQDKRRAVYLWQSLKNPLNSQQLELSFNHFIWSGSRVRMDVIRGQVALSLSPLFQIDIVGDCEEIGL
jgi:hypothetical protein